MPRARPLVHLLLAACALGGAAVQAPVDVHGGAAAADDPLAARELAANEEDHAAECAAACVPFFCGDAAATEGLPPFARHSIGPVPPNDYPGALDGPQQIFVSEQPLFTAEECERVVAMAEAEGEGLPSTKSGKYQIGKAWIKDMPGVLSWFNGALERTLFPSLAALFPALVSDASQLRAHSVAVLKYNATHPRTDLHVDDALLAFTVALSPSDSYEGGGTYFEHIDRVLHMPQGHVTFRPGMVRHGGSAISSGLRYVVGGFIAVADKVEHVRRLNERGNRLLLMPSQTPQTLTRAERLFSLGLELNPRCSLCNSNRGDALIRLERHAEAEEAYRAQTALLARDNDAWFGLGVALRAQKRNEEAMAAYAQALDIEPDDYNAVLNLAIVLGEEKRYEEEAALYSHAVALRPNDVKAYINLGISYTSSDKFEEAEDALRQAAIVAPGDARPSLNLGRLLAKLSRPAEAISAFYDAALTDPEYFDQVKYGVGTARAQQGRLSEATENFRSAHRMDPKNVKLADSLSGMAEGAAKLEAKQAELQDAVADLCGTPCQQIVDGSSVAVCSISWKDGCGDATPPDGFSADSAVHELCPRSCAWFLMQSGKL